jgi:hypothetical protein
MASNEVWAVTAADIECDDLKWYAWTELFQSEEKALECFRNSIRQDEDSQNAEAEYPPKYNGRLAIIADRIMYKIEKLEVKQ